MDDEVFEPTGQFLPSGRPIYRNQYGDFVTERTITEYVPELGGWVNIPTFFDGRLVDPQKAIEMTIQAGGVDPITSEPIEPYETMESAIEQARKKSSGMSGLLDSKFMRSTNASR